MTHVATPQIRHTTIRVTTGGWPLDAFVDDVLATYAQWREGLDHADEAYHNWLEAPATEEPRRFAAYAAALDREEAAADSYAESIAQLTRWVRPSSLFGPRPEPSLKQPKPQRRL
jgi:hypothetical protein